MEKELEIECEVKVDDESSVQTRPVLVENIGTKTATRMKLQQTQKI